MIYLDSSALLKLVHEEHESTALTRWLWDRRDTPAISSQLAKVEVLRACRRIDASALPAALALLAGLDLVPLSTDIIDAAAAIGTPELRSLDAIHLASALAVGPDVAAFVAYDRRLAAAAAGAGLDVAAPRA